MQDGPASSNGSGTRPLTDEERKALLEQPLVGIFSTLAPMGWIHSVPVHFVRDGDDVRFVTGRDSVKSRNARRSGRATLCVETSTPTERRYVSLEGAVHFEAVSLSDLARLDEKYGRSDADGFNEGTFDRDVIAVIRPVRWIAWSDRDG